MVHKIDHGRGVVNNVMNSSSKVNDVVLTAGHVEKY